MKKSLILLLILLLPFMNVCAEEKDKKEKEYRFYYIEKEYSNKFYKEGENDEEYPNKSEIFTYDIKLEEAFTTPKYEEDIVKEIPVIKYQEHQKIRYILLDNFESGQAINLQEVEIFIAGTKKEYNVECLKCTTDYFAKIQNTEYGFEKNYISGNEEMVFDLGEEYFPNDIELVLHFGGNYGYNVSYTVIANNSKDFLNDRYYSYEKDVALNFHIIDKQLFEDIEHEERLEEEVKEIEDVESVDNAKIIDKKTKYQYRTRLYQYYKENRVYVDGYYKDLPGLTKDEENYVVSEKKEEVPKTIVEYIEKEVLVPITETKEIPVIEEKIEYLTNTITKKVEVPTEVIKEVEKKVEVEKIIEKDTKTNYLLSYSVYLIFGIILKKMSCFKV